MQYTISPIIDGQYTAKIKLNSILPPSNIEKMIKDLASIAQKDPFFLTNEEIPIIKIDNDILTYTSETILPNHNNSNKKKILLVFGNPATHSIRHKMFLFSKNNYARHNMWKKLDDAQLIKNISYSNQKYLSKIEQREKEAIEKKNTISNGDSSVNYLLGLTTFYSLPTPVVSNFKFSNVLGAENFLKDILNSINQMEFERIMSYKFTTDAIIVFVQQSSYEIFKQLLPNSRNSSKVKHLIWPAVSRKKGAKNSGHDLLNMLKKAH